MAANSDAAVRRAARLADTWYVNPHTTVAEVERQLAIFRAERGSEPAELMRALACLGVTELVLRVQWPGLSQRDALRTLELLASDLLPHV
jgi:alkanesulfonate monooxygenase SsuD/methylene tetrahydromethanopterin reductase-like flavin-dependent oxidoreductase (luciferase family)